MDLRELREIKKKKELQAKRKREAEARMALFREQQRQKELQRVQDSIVRAQEEEEQLRKILADTVDTEYEGDEIVWDEDTINVENKMEEVVLEDNQEQDTLKNIQKEPVEEVANEEPQEPELKVDPLDEEIDFENYSFVINKSTQNDAPDIGLLPKKPTYTNEENVTNTDNYKFFSYSKNKRDAFWSKYNDRLKAKQEASSRKSMFSKSKDYETRFSVDGFNTNLRFDPLMGSGLQFEVMLTDAIGKS